MFSFVVDFDSLISLRRLWSSVVVVVWSIAIICWFLLTLVSGALLTDVAVVEYLPVCSLPLYVATVAADVDGRGFDFSELQKKKKKDFRYVFPWETSIYSFRLTTWIQLYTYVVSISIFSWTSVFSADLAAFESSSVSESLSEEEEYSPRLRP